MLEYGERFEVMSLLTAKFVIKWSIVLGFLFFVMVVYCLRFMFQESFYIA